MPGVEQGMAASMTSCFEIDKTALLVVIPAKKGSTLAKTGCTIKVLGRDGSGEKAANHISTA
jgi:hypothetical protein